MDEKQKKLNVSENTNSSQKKVLFNEDTLNSSETNFHDEARETTFNQDNSLTQTRVNQDEKDKETTINQEKEKETSFNERPLETNVNQQKKEEVQKNNEDEPENTDDSDADEINRQDDDKAEDGDEEKGPFKEGDIIQYMYTDWLIGGANWLWAESAKKIKTGWYNVKRSMMKKEAQKKKTRDLEKHDAYKWNDKYSKKALDDSQEKEEKFNKYNGLVEVSDKIRDGKLDETNLPDKVKTLIRNMPPQDFKKFFDKKRIKTCQENLKNNMISAMQFANLYAAVAVVNPKIQDKDFTHPNGTDNAYKTAYNEGLAFYIKALSRESANGGNIKKLSGTLLKSAQQAFDEQHNIINNGRFAGFEKKNNAWYRRAYRKVTGKKYGQPKDNEAWKQLNNLLQGINPNEPPANMFEAVLMEQDFDKGIAQEMEKINSKEYAENAQLINIDKRRKQLEDAKARILNDPAKKQAREEKESQRAIKRAQLIARLKNPNYVSTNVEGNKDVDFTNMLRDHFGVSR